MLAKVILTHIISWGFLVGVLGGKQECGCTPDRETVSQVAGSQEQAT